MITKKNYVKIAEILRKNDVAEIICEELAEYFKTDNPNFNQVKFKEACLK